MKNKWIIGFWIIWLLSQLSISTDISAQNRTRPNIIGPDGLTVNSYTGSLFFQRTDLVIPGPGLDLNLTFSYNSNLSERNVGFGKGWTFPYSMSYRVINEDDSGTDSVTFTMADGRQETYGPRKVTGLSKIVRKRSRGRSASEIGVIEGRFPPKGVFNKLEVDNDTIYTLVTKEGMRYVFDNPSHRMLTHIVDRYGRTIRIDYKNAQISEIEGVKDQTLIFDWSGENLLITDNNGDDSRTFAYKISNGFLREVTDPMQEKVSYYYDNKGRLKALTDKNDNSIDIIYNRLGAVSKVASCLSVKRIIYDTENRQTFAIDQVGSGNQETVYSYNESGNLVNKRGNCCGYNMSYDYDSDLNIKQLKDANGNNSRYNYDSRGNLLQEITAEGLVRNFQYESSFNLMTSSTDRMNNATRYMYDERGNVTEVSYPENIIESFEYFGAEHDFQLKLSRDGKGHETKFTYDAYGFPETIESIEESLQRFEYDQRGNLIEETDGRGNVTTYRHDRLNRLTTITDANGDSVTFDYDPKGNLIKIYDELRNLTENKYDALDRLIETIDPLKRSTRMAYDEMGNRISITDALNQTTTFTYDELNRLTSSTNPANETTNYGYDGNGNLTEVVYPNGNKLSYAYDRDNRLKEIRDALGLVTRYELDNNGNITIEADGNNNVTSYTYDPLNRLQLIRDALGNGTQYVFDKNSNIKEMTDAEGRKTSFDYDHLDRLISTIDANSEETKQDYDSAGNLSYITDANSNRTTYEYDKLNRLEREIYADNTFRMFAYDKRGNLEERIDNELRTTGYEYDILNRLITRDYGSTKDQFEYDALDRMTRAWNEVANLEFTYDVANRLLTESLNGQITGYGYDVYNNKNTIAYPSNNKVVVNQFDQRDRLISVGGTSGPLANFVYDPGNRLIERNYQRNNTSTSYTYDAANRLKTLVHNPGALLSYSYDYDRVGNRNYSKTQHRPASSEYYGYDQLDRLESFSKDSPSRTINIDYDAVGNRTSANINNQTLDYDPNVLNQYDPMDNYAFAHDENGNLRKDGTYNYLYDLENRLISATEGTSTTRYEYDPLGRRVKKIGQSATTTYFYAGDRVIEEHTNNEIKVYTYGRWIDDLIAFEKSGALYFYHANAIGSIAGITDIGGQLVEQYEYDTYGLVSLFDQNYQPLSSSSIGNPYFFTGRRLDTETGLYHYRARAYDPVHGRFLQRDPLGYVDGLGLYEYGLGNPQSFIDPTGKTIIHAIVYGGAAAYTLYKKSAPLVKGLWKKIKGRKKKSDKKADKTESTPKNCQSIEQPEVRKLDEYDNEQGFTAVYDKVSNRISYKPSNNGASPITLSDGSVIHEVVDQYGGHGDVADSMGGSRHTKLGFAIIKKSEDSLEIRWNSRTLNGSPVALPDEFRNLVIEQVKNEFPKYFIR